MERSLALVLAFTVLAAAPLAADFCRTDALGGGGGRPEAYARRSGGYCDGALYQENNGGALPVIGVTAAAIAGTPRSQAVRITAIPLPASLNGIAWPLQLQGVARSPELNYRLDAALSSGQPLAVGPESAMLKVVDAGLRAEDVAWAAWSESSQSGRTYVPLVMPGTAGGDVEVTVRPTIPYAYVLYSIEDSEGAVIKPKGKLEGQSAPGKRGVPVTLVVPAGRPELVVVKVIAVGNSGRTQTASLRLVRPGGAGR